MGKSPSDVVVIDNNKIYTSYFNRAGRIVPNRRLISVSLGTPENWGGAYLRELNPSPSLLSRYKQGLVSTEEYEKVYRFETLRNLEPLDIYNKTKGKVLCCWEKSGEFCHRHIILKWIEEGLGDEIIGGEI